MKTARMMARFVRSRAVWALLAVWLVGMSGVTATFMMGHWVTMPRPTTGDPGLASAVGALRSPGDQWLAVHVMYADCGCSRRVLDHILSSARPPGVADKVVMVGHVAEFERRAREQGIGVDVIDAGELASKYHLDAAPILVVVDPEGAIRYLGGYTERKQGLEIEDVEIIGALMDGRREAERPLFGCAASERLQGILDPLGIKYAAGEKSR